jgi:hypothetical protein
MEPLPLERWVGPHGALRLILIDDEEKPGNRIYELVSDHDGVCLALTGEELADLVVAWNCERRRTFVLRGVLLP